MAAFIPRKAEDSGRWWWDKYEKQKWERERRKTLVYGWVFLRAWIQEGRREESEQTRTITHQLHILKTLQQRFQRWQLFFAQFWIVAWDSCDPGPRCHGHEWYGEGPFAGPYRLLEKLSAVSSFTVVIVCKAKLSQGPLSKIWVVLCPKSLIHLPLWGRNVTPTPAPGPGASPVSALWLQGVTSLLCLQPRGRYEVSGDMRKRQVSRE